MSTVFLNNGIGPGNSLNNCSPYIYGVHLSKNVSFTEIAPEKRAQWLHAQRLQPLKPQVKVKPVNLPSVPANGIAIL